MSAPAMRSDKWTCKACRKTAYGSEKRAFSAIAHLEQINPNGRTPHRAYECPYGNGWHLTSKKERKTA